MPRSPGMSSFSQSSFATAPPTNPVSNARPGSDVVRRTFAPTGSGGAGPPGTEGSGHGVTRPVAGHGVGADRVISYVLALRVRRSGHGAKAKRAGVTVSTGRGHWLTIGGNRTTGACGADWP